MRILLACLLVLTLAACATPPDESAPTVAFPYPRMAPTAPPTPLHEDIPTIEKPQSYIWRPGHWRYDSGEFHWVAGVVMDRPSPTAVWEPDRWDKREYGWVFVPGTWW